MDWADIAEKTLAQIHRQITATAETYLNSLLTRLQQAEKPSRCLDISIDSVESDEPHRAIIDAAQRLGCDLIMMASHGRRGIGALLLVQQPASAGLASPCGEQELTLIAPAAS
jgi:nucleotide-binding universal stress UspA family protein